VAGQLASILKQNAFNPRSPGEFYSGGAVAKAGFRRHDRNSLPNAGLAYFLAGARIS
jgi:hypothetical protein